MRKKRKQRNSRGPVTTIFFLIAIVGVLSLVLSFIGFETNKTEINMGVMETSLTTIKNIISLDGIKYLFGNVVDNFKNFEPLAIVIISLIGIGICEKSGFFEVVFSPIKKIKFGIITFLTIFLGIISTIIGDYSYLFLLPFIGTMYKHLDRNPILGIITVYLGITLGYGTGIIANYNDYVLGNLTQAAALDIDKNFSFGIFSNAYIMIATTFLLAYILTIVINRFIVPKHSKNNLETEEEHHEISKTGLLVTSIVNVLLLLVVIYMILDIKLPGAGLLLDASESRYIAKLFGSGAPFKQGIVIIITLIMMISGLIYGTISKNIKNSNDYSLGLSKNFEKLGFMFVLMFFASQLIAVLNWTNIGEVVGAKLVDIMSVLKISGIPLIISFFIIVILISVFMPGTVAKWKLLSPTVVPLFMQANITPNFAQFIFKIADSVGKAYTPFFTYFIIMLAFLEKYRVDDKKKVSIFGILKEMMPVILIITVFWLIILCLWYLINLPIGVGTYTTI